MSDQSYYKHWTGRLIYTSGVRDLAERHGAYWLIDAIASYQGPRLARRDQRLHDFQVWFLKLTPKPGKPHAAILECWADTGAGDAALIRQRIEYTDFPENITLYCERGEYMTLMLPEER